MVFHHRSYNPACLTDVCEVAFWALHLVYKTTFLSVRCFVLRMYQGGSNGVNGPMVSANHMCFEHTCECLGGALHVRQAKISFGPGPCRCSALLLIMLHDLAHPLCVPICLLGVLDVVVVNMCYVLGNHCMITACMLSNVCFCHVCNAGSPGRTVLRCDWVLLGKYDILHK